MPAGRKTSLCFIGTTIEPTDRSMRQATNACVTDRQPHEWARRGTTFCFFFGKKRRRVVQFFWVMSGCPCYFVQRERKKHFIPRRMIIFIGRAWNIYVTQIKDIEPLHVVI
jgi:hypothetical protein